MKTSFDVVCAASLQRHFATREVVMDRLNKHRPQSDQNESELQKVLDKTTAEMTGYLLDETKRSTHPLSAEFFAERWDYMFWCCYSECHLSLHHHRPHLRSKSLTSGG